MKRYYYLHVWALIGYEQLAAPKPNAGSLENITIAGIVMDAWPADDLFALSPFFWYLLQEKSLLRIYYTGGF